MTPVQNNGKNLQLILLKSTESKFLFIKNIEKTAGQGSSEYYSDPNNPVLSSDNLKDFNGFTPRNYMSEDQRFAEGRPDVLTFTTDV
jgi:hypothetical protein